MSAYRIEVGEYIYSLTCECCGTEKRRVWGFVYKHGDAHAVYYALLNVREESPRVGLTVSAGLWGDGTEPSQRSWVHIDIQAEGDKLQLVIRDPKESNFYPWAIGGTPLTAEQAVVDSATAEIRAVTNFIVATDVAISSYLSGAEVNATGREPKVAEGAQRSC
jgi:hypothetical protein